MPRTGAPLPISRQPPDSGKGVRASGNRAATRPSALQRVRTAVLWIGTLMGMAAGAGCGGAANHGSVGADAVPGPWDWPTYGHDAQHTFHGRTTLTQATARTLAVAWFFRTGDAVTATPTVVDGTVDGGSWDGYFYARDLKPGAVRWKFKLSAQNAVTHYTGKNPLPITYDGGLVTS